MKRAVMVAVVVSSLGNIPIWIISLDLSTAFDRVNQIGTLYGKPYTTMAFPTA